jgi:hypothetical protein
VNKVILNWQRAVWEGDQEVEKRSGRDEPMWVAIYKCMKAMLGISLYIYLYLKLAKTLCLSGYLLWFLFNKIREQDDGIGSAQKQWGGWAESMGEMAQTMYTQVCKCKNDKIKEVNCV